MHNLVERGNDLGVVDVRDSVDSGNVLVDIASCVNRLQRDFLRQQEACGIIKPMEEPNPECMRTEKPLRVPEFLDTIKKDSELATGMQLSRSMWVSNPGYLQRDGQQTVSSFKRDFLWDEEEVILLWVWLLHSLQFSI